MQPTFSVGIVMLLVGRNTVTVLAELKWLLLLDLWLNAHHHPDVRLCLVQPGLLMDVVGDFCLDPYNAVMYF